MNPIFFPKFPHLSLSVSLPLFLSAYLVLCLRIWSSSRWCSCKSDRDFTSLFSCSYCLFLLCLLLVFLFLTLLCSSHRSFPLAFAFLIHLRVEWENVPVHCYFFNSKCDIHHSFKHLLWRIPILGWLCRNNGTLHKRAATLAALIAVKKRAYVCLEVNAKC